MRDILFSIGVFCVDFFFKREAEESLPEGGEGKPVFNGHILLRRVQNKGIGGGFFADKPEAVRDGTTVLFSAFLVYYFRLILEKGRMLRKLGAGLLAGGAASNLLDRWVRGSVTDYFSIDLKKLPSLKKLVFNLADAAIFAGTLLLGLTGRGDR